MKLQQYGTSRSVGVSADAMPDQNNKKTNPHKKTDFDECGHMPGVKTHKIYVLLSVIVMAFLWVSLCPTRYLLSVFAHGIH